MFIENHSLEFLCRFFFDLDFLQPDNDTLIERLRINSRKFLTLDGLFRKQSCFNNMEVIGKLRQKFKHARGLQNMLPLSSASEPKLTIPRIMAVKDWLPKSQGFTSRKEQLYHSPLLLSSEVVPRLVNLLILIWFPDNMGLGPHFHGIWRKILSISHAWEW